MKIFREDDIIYYSINDETPIELGKNPSCFDTSVLFGCTLMYQDGQPYYDRFFVGEFFDVSIKIFEQPMVESKATKLVYSKATLETGNKQINNKYINTGIALFDETNWGKDFEVSFNIDEIGTNSNQATMFNALLEQKPYPGVLVRIQNNKIHLEGNYLKDDGVNNITVSKEWNYDQVSHIAIKRKNNVLYYSINNSEEELELMSCEKVPKHDVPVTFGSIVKPNLTTYDRSFIGTLSNMVIKLEGETVFQYNDAKTFTGAIQNTNVYENTDIKLFDEEHIEKDFTISFNIDEFGTNSNNATILEANTVADSNYGFGLKIQNDKVRLEAKNEEGTQIQKDFEKASINQITIKKISNKLYYSINNGQDLIYLLKYSSEKKHNVPVSFGCYTDANGNFGRYFNGKFSNIKIYVEP